MLKEEYHKMMDYLKKLDTDKVNYLIQYYNYNGCSASILSQEGFDFNHDSKYYRLVFLSERITEKHTIGLNDFIVMRNSIDGKIYENDLSGYFEPISGSTITEKLLESQIVFRVNQMIDFNNIIPLLSRV